LKNYNLNIAGYNIGFEAADPGTDLFPSERFQRNLTVAITSDIHISVHSGSIILPTEAIRVFHAPFMEEVYGIRIDNKSSFWSIWKYQSELFIKTTFPLSSDGKNGVLRFSLTSRVWHLWIDGDKKEIDPFEYPLDGLILYYLTVINGDIMIHASGVNYMQQGYLFSGVSGKGKTTIARLWNNTGAKVIHDDRLIIRNTPSGYRMFNTPVYNNDEPGESTLNKIFIIEHGSDNKLVPVKEATAVSLVMVNCIQHNWDHKLISNLLGSVSTLCRTVPVLKLFFSPDKSVIDHILENE
jgi:hypothetical protein